MTVHDFLMRCQQTFGPKAASLTDDQRAVYFQKLNRFSSQQLVCIYDKVLEETKYFPKVSDIYDAAKSLGYLDSPQDVFRPHRWKDSDCNLCRGEGRLCVTWILTSEIRNGERIRVEALNRILPYSQSCDSEQVKMQDGEFRSIFRCSCLAGDASSLPKAWPKWSKSNPAVRYER